MTLPAEEPGTRLEPPGNRRPREMATLDRIRLTGLLPRSPGDGASPWTARIAWPRGRRRRPADRVQLAAARPRAPRARRGVRAGRPAAAHVRLRRPGLD